MANAQQEGQVPPPPQGPPPAVLYAPPQAGQGAFALTPGKATANAVIDYSTSDGAKLYRSATQSLYRKDATAFFDCKPHGLKDFMDLLRDRSMEYGWEISVVEVAMDTNDMVNGDFKSLIDHHGEITLEQVQEHARAYVNQPNRAAQDSVMLYQCLMNSLSMEGRSKITAWRKDYTVHGITSGACLLKVIIRESHVDTHATTAYIRTQLASLDDYMNSVGSDVEKFNIYVHNLVEQLTARGQKTQDLLTNLFKGYKAAKDRKFVEYMEKKEEDYEEGQDIRPEQLMTLASNKYKILKQKDVWQAPSPEEAKIIALEAKIEKLQKFSKKNGGKEKSQGGKPHTPGNDGKKKKNKEKPAWMLLKPNDISKSKMVDGKEYWWCPNHECWTRHKPSECMGKGKNPNGQKLNNDSKESKDNKKKLKIVKAIEAIIEQNGDSDEE
jgi:hypothetical protein